MGVIPISLIELLKGAHGIIGFAVSCDLTAMTNVDSRFTDDLQTPTAPKRDWLNIATVDLFWFHWSLQPISHCAGEPLLDFTNVDKMFDV
uniref:Uncharacterized protein n=1 Tax=Romanomermis culicivorax TaxID=13658 RepID=A0A915KCG9_ROMCU